MLLAGLSILTFLGSGVAIIALRLATGSYSEQAALNKEVRLSLSRSVKYTDSAELSLFAMLSEQNSAKRANLNSSPQKWAERTILLKELAMTRLLIQSSHLQYGNLSVFKLRAKLTELRAIEAQSLQLRRAADLLLETSLNA